MTVSLNRGGTSYEPYFLYFTKTEKDFKQESVCPLKCAFTHNQHLSYSDYIVGMIIFLYVFREREQVCVRKLKTVCTDRKGKRGWD